ncbi:efflux transporter periplasmic adaptor subunit [Halobacteriovorax marinus]|uniref:Efflux transporter periplasmic adaptor subunit n=1 Tax=Halobacteriovorax marinus TaxID=97084 RepID=A0A1Y5FCE5_9BACT|nr:efflux transporter periplasmic adaptor subunit [Halobacteriovorax marinus]
MNNFRLIFLTLLLTVSFGCTKEAENKASMDTKEEVHDHTSKTFYTCAMHPQIKEDKPGKCPICHMNLTKIEFDESDKEEMKEKKVVVAPTWICKDYPDVTSEFEDICPIDGSPMIMKMDDQVSKVIAKVKLRKSQLKHFYPEYFPVTNMKMSKKVRLLGSVLQSEEKESSIPARISGRVEKVFVKSTGSLIRVGDPVIKIYSPKLITAGEEYLLAKKSFLKTKSKEFKDMLKQSEERLRLWGVKKKQYNSWYRKGVIPKSIVIYSPATGIVRKRNAVVGKYFKEGQNFFELSDLSVVWVEMDVYEQDAGIVSLGQKVELEFTSVPGTIIEGSIDFVDPILDMHSRTLKIRTTIQNSTGKLKPGMVADAILTINFEGTPLVIPRTAIIDTGKRKVVWQKVSNKQFRAIEIHTGHESEGYVEVKHGLSLGDEVVMEGSFVLDAQAQLFGGYEDPTSEMDSKKNAPVHNH